MAANVTNAIADKRAHLAAHHDALVAQYNETQARLNLLANELLKTQGAIAVLDELSPPVGTTNGLAAVPDQAKT